MHSMIEKPDQGENKIFMYNDKESVGSLDLTVPQK